MLLEQKILKVRFGKNENNLIIDFNGIFVVWMRLANKNNEFCFITSWKDNSTNLTTILLKNIIFVHGCVCRWKSQLTSIRHVGTYFWAIRCRCSIFYFVVFVFWGSNVQYTSIHKFLFTDWWRRNYEIYLVLNLQFCDLFSFGN